MSRFIPAGCLGILELRLAGGSSAVDFAVRLASPEDAWTVAPFLSSSRARSFLSAWAQERPDLRAVSSVWLEFDAPPAGGRGATDGDLPTPLLCARLAEDCDRSWLSSTLLPAMHGELLPASQRTALDRCLDAVPQRARVLYAFSLLGRPGEGVRIELYGLDPGAMARYLRTAVSAEAAEELESVAHLLTGAERFHLSFDIGAGVPGTEISPRIGVECGLRHQPRREPRWRALLDGLVAQGLASGAKRDAVLAWPGQDSLWTAADCWPSAGVGLGGHAARCLSHLKLVLRPSRVPEAKAYLLFQHLPAPASRPVPA